MKKPWLFRILAVSTVMAGIVFGWPKIKAKFTYKNEQETLGEVTLGDLVQRVSITGMIAARRSTLVTAPYDGYIRKIYAKIGDTVKEGDPLVTMSPSAHQIGEELYPTRAPFAGTVVQVGKSEGEFIEKGVGAQNNHENAILRIDDLSKFYVEAEVSENDYPKLKNGQNVIIKISALGGEEYKGTIESIAKASKSQDRWDRSRVEYPLKIVVDNHDKKIVPGMSAIVDVITSELKNIALLKHEFIQKDNVSGKYFVTTSDGKKVDIEIGSQNSDAIEVKSGLVVGDKVRMIDFLTL
jgi:multidrug efflux pump subunit AcrA (membrane-fusion protein)